MKYAIRKIYADSPPPKDATILIWWILAYTSFGASSLQLWTLVDATVQNVARWLRPCWSTNVTDGQTDPSYSATQPQLCVIKTQCSVFSSDDMQS